MYQIEFIRGLNCLRPEHRGSVVTIGAFDGVHLGHQKLIEQVKRHSLMLSLPSVVVLFEPQPNEYFGKGHTPTRLMRLREKVVALAAQGVDRVLCLKFDKRLRAMTASEFAYQILVEGLGAKHLIIGDDFHFGCDRLGDFAFLTQFGQENGFTVSDTNTHEFESDRVSSTRVRALLANARLDAAAALLGSRYRNSGRVVYGKQLGRKLGFPTLNIGLGRLQVPFTGVFAVSVIHRGNTYNGVANVGTRPTVDGNHKPILEVHLLDVSLNLYGEFVTVIYLFKIRDEHKFNSVAELQENIRQDVVTAKRYFSERPSGII